MTQTKDEYRPDKYKVTKDFAAVGKLCLITGAAGNAGGHFALGMPAACGCDALLADVEEYHEEMDEVLRDIKTAKIPGKIYVETIREEDLKERELFYENLEEKYGNFACILDVYGINTARTFPGSADIVQLPVKSPRDLKLRYQVGDHVLFTGLRVLVIGAGGLWGSHMAAGMAAAQADLILIDSIEKKEAVLELLETLKSGTKADIEYVSEEMMNDRAAILSFIKEKYGMPDAILDVRHINPEI